MENDGIQTLDDLKKANELADKKGDVKDDADQDKDEKDEEIKDDDGADDAQGDDDAGDDDKEDDEKKDDDKPTIEPFMEADGDEPSGFVPDATAAAIRRKYSGKAKEANERADKAEREAEELRRKLAEREQQKPAIKDKPKRDDFENEEAFLEALTDWKLAGHKAEVQTQQTAEQRQRAMQEQAARTAKAVDGHYTRAAGLAEKSGIKPEVYQAADRAVRMAVDSVFEGAGDAITDALIASVGDGSEKVFYHLGVNAKKRERLVELLREDRSGIRAATYLGSLAATLNVPAKRETKAPNPPPDVKGDKQPNAKGKALREKYEKAIERGDTQTAFNLKRQAKGLKVDTSDW